MTRNLRKVVLRLVTWAALSGGFVACASYTVETAAMREAFSRGDYDQALESLEKSGIKNRSQDRLLWHLEAATILDRKGDYEQSRDLWLKADRIADELFTISIKKTATSFVVSESSTDYEGEDYEQVSIHSMLAHQFISQDRLAEARVEARRINTKLSEINQKFNPDGKYRYREDAHARYLSGIIFEALGELDSAIVDYEKARVLYEGDFSGYVLGGVPSGVIQGLYRCLLLRGRTDRVGFVTSRYANILGSTRSTGKYGEFVTSGEIVVIHELGRVARKIAREEFLTIGGQLVRFSSPMIRPNPIQDLGTGVTLDTKGFTRAENTVYFDAIAQDSLENRRGRMIAKQMSRLLLKGQINYQARREFGPLGGLAANVLTLAAETADTRSWSTLPQAFYVTRVRVTPGTYNIIVKTNGQDRATTVTVPRGGIQILRSFDR